MAGPVESVSQFRVEHLSELMHKMWWRISMLLVPIVVGVVAIVAVPGPNPILVFVVAVAVVALAGTIGTYVLADRRAKSDFFRAWARARGWSPDSGLWQDQATPLLCAGERRETGDRVSGPLAGGGQAVVCHYTYEVRVETTDSRGVSTTSLEPHPFTVVQAAVADTGLPGLTLHPRSFGHNRLFDKLDSTLTSNRVVNLESSELEHRYKLEVADETSDLAVRMLFEPAFIVWCLDQAADRMLLELANGTLVVAIPDHSYDAAQLDGLVAKAAAISTRLADAARATTPKEA